MPIIRTPDEKFENLPDYPFAPHYVEVNGLRMHYVDEGVGDPILCLHGEPSWSFLYRKMIPPLTAVGRVIAPDLIGFGKSDKYTTTEEYSFDMHLDMLIGFINALDLQNITVLVQDWGGLLGLAAVGKLPERFARIVVMNTFLPTGDREPSKAFIAWQTFAKVTPILPVGKIIQGATVSKMPKEVVAAYDAPFPSRKYQAGAKIFPALVPMKATDPGVNHMQLAREVLGAWQKPAIVLFSDKDPVLGGARSFFMRLIPSVQNQENPIITDGGHFLQEDKGPEIADHIVQFIQNSPIA